ncbi:MAG: CBS domain-containing protein [Desulfobulbaceae bacterium]|nr:CBS domain-containing protein [Desulfobulbaceae bacterium]
MTKEQTTINSGPDIPEKMDISDDDVYAAMQEIPGYLDITASDFKQLYQHAYQHAVSRLIHSSTAGELASRRVISVAATTPLAEVAHKMAEAAVSGVPVLNEQGRVAGIVSERDFLRHMDAANQSFMAVVAACLRGKGCAAVSIRKGTAADIMSSPPVTIREDTLVIEAAVLLREKGINRLPVLAGDSDKLVGILTRTDLVNAHLLQSRRDA